MPAGGSGPYTVRHGFGYSVFEHESNGIRQSLTMFAALDPPVKICIVSLKNLTGRQRRLRMAYYMRPVLGVTDSLTSPFITTKAHKNGMLCIENRFIRDFRGRIAFLAVNSGNVSYTCDRALFHGGTGEILQSPPVCTVKISMGQPVRGWIPVQLSAASWNRLLRRKL